MNKGRRTGGERGYLVVGSKPWNRKVFDRVIRRFPGKWHFVGRREDLHLEGVRAINPRYIFFLHWSWLVPEEIVRRYECVCFHMTDVPFGRGGSPLQNLIVRGYRATKLTALKMTEEFDAGPVYLKEPLSLEGGAEEVYIRATNIAAGMIRHIVDKEPRPFAQRGRVVVFRRRKAADSRLPLGAEFVQELHDFIRMLDADGYPRAFIEYGRFRLEFARSTLYDDRIEANVVITQKAGSGA